VLSPAYLKQISINIILYLVGFVKVHIQAPGVYVFSGSFEVRNAVAFDCPVDHSLPSSSPTILAHRSFSSQ